MVLYDLQVLVEYDDVEWQRREWLSPHRDAVFSFFLIEKGLCWAERPDPRHTSLIAIDHHNQSNNNHHNRINGKSLRGTTAAANTVAWPALVSILNIILVGKNHMHTITFFLERNLLQLNLFVTKN